MFSRPQHGAWPSLKWVTHTNTFLANDDNGKICILERGAGRLRVHAVSVSRDWISLKFHLRILTGFLQFLQQNQTLIHLFEHYFIVWAQISD